MRLHLSPFAFLRRHAWGAGRAVRADRLAYFATIGWVAGKLRTDLGQHLQAGARRSKTRGHRAD